MRASIYCVDRSVDFMSKWNRHVGVYGFCYSQDKLLVIHKNKGPYTGRFDLPGGTIEPDESIIDALHREFYEETGCRVKIVRNAGVRDFVVPWTRAGHDHSHCQHIALFFEVEFIEGDVERSPRIDDSKGAAWMDISLLKEDNSSPLVMEALNWIRTGKIGTETVYYDEWVVMQ